ncbi:MAG TPA: NINE protein, partial [Thermoanaerobaculia bacterium]|nr:NINE protein [Thermoanaerobaculia bacterium]
RFYLGHTGLGILKLVVTIVTCGIGGFVWWIIDIVLIVNGSMKDSRGRMLVKT